MDTWKKSLIVYVANSARDMFKLSSTSRAIHNMFHFEHNIILQNDYGTDFQYNWAIHPQFLERHNR